MAARCDYEVEMIRTQGGVKTVAKERISLKPTLDTITPNTGAVTARYIRLRPSSTATSANPYLYISQIVALDTTGRNVALGRTVFSTSTFLDITNNIRSADPNLITDGTVTSRSMPNIWGPVRSRHPFRRPPCCDGGASPQTKRGRSFGAAPSQSTRIHRAA